GFAVFSNVERLSEFSHLTVEIRKGPGRTVEVDDTFEQTVKVFGVDLDTEWEVTELSPNTLVRFEGRSKGDGPASLTQRISADGEAAGWSSRSTATHRWASSVRPPTSWSSSGATSRTLSSFWLASRPCARPITAPNAPRPGRGGVP